MRGRTFNTAGPCRPEWHYMLPPQRRLPEILPLIEEGAYFVLHAARQSGKTTLLQSLAASLRESGRFAALVTSCSPYSEAAAQLVFMAFLHKVVNGGGSIERELAVGRGRVDLCIRWPYFEGGSRKIQSQAIELKVWRDGAPNPLEAGVEQLAQYLERLSLHQGTLLIFHAKKAEPPLPQRQRTEVREHRGLRIEVSWL